MLVPPTVSVVMCTYNGSRYIDEQIHTIVQQDAAIKELIIVDDCSTDDTWQKLQTWQHRHVFISLHQNKENLGYNSNFEKAIRMATGTLIALSDQDDIWMPQKISRLVAAFSDPQVMLAHSRSVQLKNGKLDYNKTRLQYHYDGTDVRRFFFFNQVMGHDAMFRQQLVQAIFPIPAGVIYDWWIAVNALARGRIASVPEFLVHHRIHSSNSFFSTTSASKKKELDLNETLRLMAAIPVLRPADRHYLETLIELIEEKNAMPVNYFSQSLFRFLYQHRRIIFGQKKRLLPEIAYLKGALKYARFNYKGSGLSV